MNCGGDLRPGRTTQLAARACVKHDCDFGDHEGNGEKRTADQASPPAAAAGGQFRRAERKSGAGEGARTLDPDLGKVVLYH